MRWLVLAFLCGCGGAPAKMTGLVVALQYDPDNIASLVVRGAAPSRSFGPYSLAASQAPPSSTVGLLFDASDAGQAMVCADAREQNGDVRQSGCIMPTVLAQEIVDVTLRLSDVH